MADEVKTIKSQDELERGEAMTWEDIQSGVNQEIQAATQYVQENIAPERIEHWDRYYGRALGNEVSGRSQYVSRDFMDVVEWMLPYLIRQFTSTDPKVDIQIEGQEPWVGLALLNKIREDMAGDKDTSLFRLFYQWFKDALVSGFAVIKPFWVKEAEVKKVSWDRLGMDEMTQLHNDPDVTFTDFEAGPVPGTFQNVETEVKSLRRVGLSAINVPHWEFICSAETQSMNDETGKGQRTRVTVDYLKRVNRARGGNFFKHLDMVEHDTLHHEDRSDVFIHGETEKDSYKDDAIESDRGAEARSGPGKEVEFVEWYTRKDVDGDGYLEDIVVFMADKKLIRWQKNDEGMIRLCGLNPLIDCYKMFGISLGHLVADVQNLKTMLVRRTLDNFEFVNLGIWLSSDDNIDYRKLLSAAPGDFVKGDPNNTERVAPGEIGQSSFALLGYADQVRENRTGVASRQGSMGATPEHKTAKGMEMLYSSTISRLELVARIFAETGISDFYQKCVQLYQQNMEQPFKSRVKGQDVVVDANMIQGRVICQVNMGIEAEIGQFEAAKIEQIARFLTNMNETMPGILGIQQVHNLASRYVSSMGFRQTDDFVPGLKQLAEALQGKAEQDAQMMQMQMGMAQGEQQVQQGELQLKAAKVQGDLDSEDRKLALEERKIEQQRQKDFVEARLKVLGIKLDDKPQVNI